LQPAISPDGTRLLFVQSRTDYMIVSASLSDGTVKRVLSSELPTGMPAWAAHQQQFVYDSLRNGSPGIWMRSESGDRALVGTDAFPPGSTNDFGTPALSPNADRVLYAREDNERQGFNWISAVNGGPPVRVTSDKGAIELGGAWSPDGKSIVYWKFHDNMAAIMTVTATGEAAPTLLRDNVFDPLPEWSPDGRWITFEGRPDSGGWSVISPDGKTIKSFGEPNTIQMTFSADSAKLYGIRVETDRTVLYSIEIASGAKKEIGDLSKDFTPSSYTNPGIRLSLAPDGKSILYPARRVSSGLWMLEGYERLGWLDRFH
jgi:Tol biopolymer transport system component